jgi:hypothetical protein
MAKKQTLEQLMKRILAVNAETPEAEIENLILAVCNRIRSGDPVPPGYSGKWDYVLFHIARRWNGSDA